MSTRRLFSFEASRRRPQSPPPPERRYVDAVHDALDEAMARDPRVILLGQDIAEYGGVFKCTEGLAAKFGKSRVRNTPIVESGAVGAAMGLALDGFVPMVRDAVRGLRHLRLQSDRQQPREDALPLGGAPPVVFRLPVGGGMGAGPFHSQNMEAWFTQVAGLKVVAPATPFDAKGLLLASFEDGNPVLVLEHKGLYRSAKGRVPAGHYTLPSARRESRARARTRPSSPTASEWSGRVRPRETLAAKGSPSKSIDLRTLLPWDRRDGRGLGAQDLEGARAPRGPVTGGFGGEIAATILAECFQDLDAPVEGSGGLDMPVPFSKALEEIFMPKARLLDALRRLRRPGTKEKRGGPKAPSLLVSSRRRSTDAAVLRAPFRRLVVGDRLGLPKPFALSIAG
jgi:2-oxoisovalerate dehydrogenase E1 component